MLPWKETPGVNFGLNFEGIFWQKCCQAAQIQLSGAGCLPRRHTAGTGSFGKLFSGSWPEINRSEAFWAQLFVEQNPFRMLTLWTWEFSAVWAHRVAVTIKRKNCQQIQIFLMLHPLLSLWSPPSSTHLQHSSFIPLLGTPRKPCWNFTCSHSRKDTCEQWSPSSWEHHPAGAFSCLFGNRASPLSFPACCRQNHPWTTRFNACPTVQGGLQHLLVLQVCHQHPNTAVKYAKSITDRP